MQKRHIISMIALTYALNFIWESTQAPLYTAYEGYSQNWFVCAKAALGDLVIIGAMFTSMTLLFGKVWVNDLNPKYFMVLFLIGGLLAVLVEKWGLNTGRWQYDGMPIVPLLNVGLTPILQMLALPPAIVYSFKALSR
jgi:hypothetical protein